MKTTYCSLFLAGFGFGAAMAAIMTPKSGPQIRGEVQEKVAEGVRSVKEGVECARGQLAREAKRIDAAWNEGVKAYREGRGVVAEAIG